MGIDMKSSILLCILLVVFSDCYAGIGCCPNGTGNYSDFAYNYTGEIVACGTQADMAAAYNAFKCWPHCTGNQINPYYIGFTNCYEHWICYFKQDITDAYVPPSHVGTSPAFSKLPG